MARLMRRRALNGMVANMPIVQGALDELAQEVAARAKADLARRHKPDPEDLPSGKGEPHRIEVSDATGKYGHVDRQVSMIGPAPAALEYGHRHNRSGRFVRGTYILHKAAGLM